MNIVEMFGNISCLMEITVEYRWNTKIYTLQVVQQQFRWCWFLRIIQNMKGDIFSDIVD